MELTVDNPEFPKDFEFRFAGLGTVKNGGSLDVTDELQQSFEQEQGQTVAQAFKDHPWVSVKGKGSGVVPKGVGLIPGVHVGGSEHLKSAPDTEDAGSLQAEAAQEGEVVQTGPEGGEG